MIPPESYDEVRHLWLAAEERERVLRSALFRIAERADRIQKGKVQTTAIGAATYTLDVAITALDSTDAPKPPRPG